MTLSDQQQAVVDWVREDEGSLNLVARAGCGKTFTLIRGVVRAIVENDLGEVALMAYNKSAGDEFKERLKSLADETEDKRFLEWKRVQAGTVHSFGFGMVRRWARDVKVDDKKVAGICERLHVDTPPEPGRESVYKRERGPICKLVSLAKQTGFGALVEIGDRRAWFDLAEHHAVNDLTEGGDLTEVVEASITVLKASIQLDREVIDFDDMILAPLTHKLRAWPKDWVLIDEAQDTNPARRALALKLLKPRTGRLVAVGDDRQAIYGFTGADHDALDRIAESVGSITLPLNVTYRCPKTVVAEANRLVPDLTAHETAPEGAVRSIRADVGIVDPEKENPGIENLKFVSWFRNPELQLGPTDAILCRNTKPLVETAYGLLAAGIGCRVEGREIGNGLIKLATRWKRIKTLPALESKLADYRDREVQKWLAKEREERAQAAEDKVDALLAICSAVRSEGKDSVADVVDWIDRLFGDTRDGEIPNVITLSTIHKAKGREWKRVFLLHRDATLPSPWARKPWQMRQEENLEYVAITRAEEELIYVD